MKNELVKINASDYGLEETKAKEIESLFLPMLSKMSELENEYNDILKNEINPETCQRAKDLRLGYVKIRTGTADIHKKAKEFYLNGGRFVDGWKNAQLFASGEKERTLKNIEDHFENQEKERLDKLRSDRIELLKPYTDIEPLALGHMEQSVFDNYLTGVKIAHEQRIAAEKKAEDDRLAAIEVERVRQENIRLENEKLKADAIEKERLAEIERKKNAEILKAQELKASNERSELLLKAKKEQDEYREKTARIQKEKERLEKEIADKKAADEKKLRDAELQKQADEKARKDAEKKAMKAPDKTKLLDFGQALNDVPRPEIKSIEAAEIMANINGYLVKLNNFIIENANKL